MNKYSVLMSVYAKDDAVLFSRALRSVKEQTMSCSQVVLIKDGPLTDALEAVINEFVCKLPLEVVSLSVNSGLAIALNTGLPFCKHEFVGRLDADDFCAKDRFELQIRSLANDSSLAVIGSWIVELDEFDRQTLKKMPVSSEECARAIRHVNPLCHPSVCFRKSVVLSVGGYPLFQKGQDFALWSILISKGHRVANIPSVLVYMSSGLQMMSRRGPSFFRHEIQVLRFQYELQLYRFHTLIFNVISRLFLRFPPRFIRGCVYKYLRR